MSRYHKKKNDRPPLTEDDLKEAFHLLRGKSLRKVSAMTGIKKSTLHDYRQKLKPSLGQPLKELAHGNQVLSKQ